MTHPLDKAIEKAGGQTALANGISKIVGKTVNQSDVWYWRNEAKKGIPAEYCPAIEQFTGVPKEHLRPDVVWSA